MEIVTRILGLEKSIRKGNSEQESNSKKCKSLRTEPVG
jgi:hypothetical protein